jgi:hypothetical protein
MPTWLFVNGSKSIWIERPYKCSLIVAGPGTARESHDFMDERTLDAFQIATAERLARTGWMLIERDRRSGGERRAGDRDTEGRRQPLTFDGSKGDRRMQQGPWRCPACRQPIQHNEFEERPRQGAHYRCHVCRLELVFDPDVNKMTVAPVRDDEPDQKQRQTS